MHGYDSVYKSCIYFYACLNASMFMLVLFYFNLRLTQNQTCSHSVAKQAYMHLRI